VFERREIDLLDRTDMPFSARKMRTRRGLGARPPS
jgi:hypothetical protein